MMLSEKEKSHIESEIQNFKSYLSTIGKEFPKNQLIYNHTYIYVRRILGYDSAPIYFNPSVNKYTSLLFAWKEYIMNELQGVDEDLFKKINAENNDHDQPSLKDIKTYILGMTTSI